MFTPPPPTGKLTPLQVALIGLFIFAALYAIAVAIMLQYQIRCGALCGHNVLLFILKGVGH